MYEIISDIYKIIYCLNCGEICVDYIGLYVYIIGNVIVYLSVDFKLIL